MTLVERTDQFIDLTGIEDHTVRALNIVHAAFVAKSHLRRARLYAGLNRNGRINFSMMKHVKLQTSIRFGKIAAFMAVGKLLPLLILVLTDRKSVV